jgi:hypothetical protein
MTEPQPAKRVADYDSRDQAMPSYYQQDGVWYLHLPIARDDDFDGLTANLVGHKVEEHSDGTISVTPSILVSDHLARRHGYLTRGIWQEC